MTLHEVRETGPVPSVETSTLGLELFAIVKNAVLLDHLSLHLLHLALITLHFILEVLGLLLCPMGCLVGMDPPYHILGCVMTMVSLQVLMDHMVPCLHFHLELMEAWAMAQGLLPMDTDLAFRDLHGQEYYLIILLLVNAAEGQMVYMKGIGFVPNVRMLTLPLEPIATSRNAGHQDLLLAQTSQTPVAPKAAGLVTNVAI
ncbi:uncharacterized protein LOC122292118 isoform X2 [Carya illinoinensis]|uniref:uncharacterized protein LOC122292118 isoform X2 n=1 Tax=Carya illinoinensis TaxID=32201 RepID=UPI001C721C1D|nr:uncharacterized protein LOC122292118 isoform X2 [Carya illinoinensis]